MSKGNQQAQCQDEASPQLIDFVAASLAFSFYFGRATKAIPCRSQTLKNSGGAHHEENDSAHRTLPLILR
jgi:hypothetical protein